MAQQIVKQKREIERLTKNLDTDRRMNSQKNAATACVQETNASATSETQHEVPQLSGKFKNVK